ncbi:MAG: HPF/RaiA family ribosome-associated protein [Alphaproteobacteria bacterium]|nr:HPF/RaiA family ribosome-associated protein [Alphaproteobacteria bacterium]
MEHALQIVFRGMDPSDAVEAAIRDRAEKLQAFFDRIVSCRVVVEAPHRHQQKGKLYAVKVELDIPGGNIAVTHSGPQDHAHEDVYVAVRDAFDAARRLLEDRIRRMRDDVKTHARPLHGKILRLFPGEGYGFVETPDGEVYFHRNSIVGARFDDLKVGGEVRLVVAEGESAKGPQASTVTPIGKHHIVD